MRREFVFRKHSAAPRRFRLTATRVRREVIFDGPAAVESDVPRFDYRMRFSLEEAQILLALLTQAVATAAR